MTTENSLDYSKLADALLANQDFAKKLLGFMAKNIKDVPAEHKNYLREFCHNWRKEQEQTIKSDLDKWASVSIKNILDGNKTALIDRINRSAQQWVDSEMHSQILSNCRQAVERLIHDKFANTEIKFNIGSLFKRQQAETEYHRCDCEHCEY